MIKRDGKTKIKFEGKIKDKKASIQQPRTCVHLFVFFSTSLSLLSVLFLNRRCRCRFRVLQRLRVSRRRRHPLQFSRRQFLNRRRSMRLRQLGSRQFLLSLRLQLLSLLSLPLLLLLLSLSLFSLLLLSLSLISICCCWLS